MACRTCATATLTRKPEDSAPLASSKAVRVPVASLDGFGPVPGRCPTCGQSDAPRGHAARLMDATLEALNSGSGGFRPAGNSEYAHKNE